MSKHVISAALGIGTGANGYFTLWQLQNSVEMSFTCSRYGKQINGL